MKRKTKIRWYDVILAVAISDRMKECFRSNFDERQIASLNLYQKIKSLYQTLKALSPEKLISDTDRLARIKSNVWTFKEIKLEKLWVWPQMGGCITATGKVFDIILKIKSPKTEEEQKLAQKIKSMTQIADFIKENLPIVIFPVGLHKSYDDNCPDRDGYDIDDGSHRAVTLAFVGFDSTNAWVAESKENEKDG